MKEVLFILLISPLLKRHTSENLPCPLFAKEGKFLPFAKGGKEGLEGRCLDNYGLLSKVQ
jgi:hypothetical protein